MHQSDPNIDKAEQCCWYALRVYRNMVSSILELCRQKNIEFYIPMRLVEWASEYGVKYVEKPVISNLIFVRTTRTLLAEIKLQSRNRFTVYCYPGTQIPAPIDDHDMEIFMFVVKTGPRRLEVVDLPIDKGDKVRVTEGLFKGAEGYVRRVHGTKLFVVVLEGIAALAVAYIPKQYLERVNPKTQPIDSFPAM